MLSLLSFLFLPVCPLLHFQGSNRQPSMTGAVGVPPGPKQKPRPHERNGWGVKTYGLGEQQHEEGVRPGEANASPHETHTRAGRRRQATSVLRAARSVSVSRWSCYSGTAGNGVAWPCTTARVRKRKARVQCQAGRSAVSYLRLIQICFEVNRISKFRSTGHLKIYIEVNRISKRNVCCCTQKKRPLAFQHEQI